MGMGTNIIVFMLLFTFGLQVYCGSPIFANATCPFQFSYSNIWNGITTGLFSSLSGYALLAGVGLAVIGMTIFPNPYALFLGISLSVMSLADPNGILYTAMSGNGWMPEPIGGLFRNLIIMLFIVAIIAWYAIRDVF